jgi:regulator of protease activity HflC (stomatin/prohibitin superfamily)
VTETGLYAFMVRWRRSLWAALVVMGLVILAASGLRVVPPGEVALVYRFGKLVGDDLTAVRQPGMLWAWPEPIDRVVLLASKRESKLEVVAFWPPQAEVEDQPSDADDEASLDDLAVDPATTATEPLIDDPVEQVAANASADASVTSPPDTGASRGEYSLTGDRGLVALRLTTRYVIAWPARFQRSAADPQAVVERMVVRELQKAMLRSSLDEVLQQRVAWPRRVRASATDSLSRSDSPMDLSSASDASSAREVGNLADIVREEAQLRLEEMSSGVRLTSLEIQAARPPREVRAAFDLLQTARIEQETTQARMQAQADEVLYDSESLALQVLAEAKGNAALRKAEITRQLAMFDAELEGVKRLGRAAAMTRLRDQTLRDIIAQCERAYFVTEPPPGGTLRLRVSGEAERP